MNEMARILTGKTILRGDENWKYGKGSRQDLTLLPEGVGYVDETELTALQPDGEVIYTRQFPSGLSSPTSASDGTIYVHDRSQLHAVGPDGATRWTYDVRSTLDPAAGEQGQVYLVDTRGRLKGVSEEGQELFDRGLKWFWQKGSFVEPRIGPEGKVLVADRDRRVKAFSADGDRLWSYKLPASGLVHGPVWGPDGSVALTTMDNEVVRLDPQGRETHRVGFEDELTCAPLFHPDGTLTVGDYFGKLYRIEGDDSRAIGHFPTQPIHQELGPDGQLIVTTRWGGVHVLGEPRWELEVGGLGGHSLTSQDGIVYVNSPRGGLNAIRTHRDPEAARAEEKRKALQTFQAGQEPVEQAGIKEEGGYLLVGGIRVPRKQAGEA